MGQHVVSLIVASAKGAAAVDALAMISMLSRVSAMSKGCLAAAMVLSVGGSHDQRSFFSR